MLTQEQTSNIISLWRDEMEAFYEIKTIVRRLPAKNSIYEIYVPDIPSSLDGRFYIMMLFSYSFFIPYPFEIRKPKPFLETHLFGGNLDERIYTKEALKEYLKKKTEFVISLKEE